MDGLIVVIAIVLVVANMLSKMGAQAKKQAQEKSAFEQAAQQATEKKAEAPAHTRTVLRAAVPLKQQEDAQTHRGKDGRLHPTERVIASRLLDIAKERPTRLGDAKEGADPCHEYMLDDKNLPLCEDEMDTPETDDTDAEPARELLRGVILSEVLTRPNLRKPVWRRP